MKGEDILERASVPEEGWMDQRVDTRLFGGAAQASTGGEQQISRARV